MKTVPLILCCCAFALITFCLTAVALPVATEEQDEITTNINTSSESLIESSTETTTETTESKVILETTEPPSTTPEPPSTTPEPPSTTPEPPSTTPEPPSTTPEPPSTTPEIPAGSLTPEKLVKDEFSDQIRKILKRYQKPNSRGHSVPDPLSIPTMKRSFGLPEITFFNMTVHGLSKFKGEFFNVDLQKMQADVLLRIKQLYVLGNYTLQMMFFRPSSAGPFNVTLTDVEAAFTVALEPNGDGVLKVAETDTILTYVDVQYKDCESEFEDLNPVFQDMNGRAGSALCEDVKPFVVDRVNDMMADVDDPLKTYALSRTELSVPDMAVAEGRAYVRRMGYDPYRVADRRIKYGPANFTATDLSVSGLSDFRRVGDVGLQVQGPVIQMSVHVITGRLRGTLRWAYHVATARSIDRSGVSDFTVDHVRVRAVVRLDQTLDVRGKPVLDDLEIEVGKIVVSTDGPNQYSSVGRRLPSMLGELIVDVLEKPIKTKVQTILDDVQVENTVEKRFPEFDGMSGQ